MMLYLHTSVVLAQLLSEDRRPPPQLWTQPLVASRLLQYELWTRLHARNLAATHGAAVASVLSGISIIELTPQVLARALEPFPRPLRTLDALHLASCEYLRTGGVSVELASYDERMLAVAGDLGIPLSPLAR